MEHLTVELVHQLLSGKLDADTARQCRTHLDQCARCREMVENERAWAGVLDLGQDPGPATPTPSVERLLERVDRAVPQVRRRHRRKSIGALAGWTLATVLTGLLAWQVAYPPGTSDPDSPTTVTHELRARTVAHLDELQVLEREPWLVDDYETVRTLDELIREYREPR